MIIEIAVFMVIIYLVGLTAYVIHQRNVLVDTNQLIDDLLGYLDDEYERVSNLEQFIMDYYGDY